MKPFPPGGRVVCLSIFACIALGGFCESRGSVIVYEGFDYGATESNLGGLGNTTELGLQGTWVNNGGAGTTTQYMPSGLTFSDLLVSGGLAQINAIGAGTGDRTAGAARQIAVDAQTGTLWGSYLFNPISDAAARSVSSLLHGNAANITDNTAYFSLANNEFNVGVGGVRISNSAGGGAAAATGGVTLTLNTTYLYLFKLENIGAAGGTPQSATMWMLNEAQFDNFKSGGLDEAELNSAAIGAGATGVMQRATRTTAGLAAPGTFDGTDFLRFFNFSGGELITQFDEIRFANGSLAEVAPVPEPSTFVAIASGIGVLLGLQRTRRRR
jgi:hypothetical protein